MFQMAETRHDFTPPITLADVAVDGPPLRIRDLELLTGLDGQTLRRDIKGGHLSATVRQRGPRYSMFLVERAEARRYLKTLGIHAESPRTR